jgi:hypothetical protein
MPEYMVPSAIVVMERMPLTPNGKVDRNALPEPSINIPELEQAYVAPRGPIEEILTSVWANVLRIERVGINDNFFALGGDSMRTLQVISQAGKRGLSLSVQHIYRYQTVAELAHAITVSMGLDELTGENFAEEEYDEDALRILEELEGLSEDEVGALLREKQLVAEERNQHE